ncbi:hypothetical protein [Acinetobacter sp.]|uniref:hypothetical protein n=1 Tax=Acinetobacter sp. TaxID=472 RepID=UPI00388FA02A
MAKLTGDIIKAGLHVWVAGLDKKLNIPVEVVIDTGEVYRCNIIEVTCVADDASNCCHRDPNTGRHVIYLGDAGVRPYNYDSRAVQVFTTKGECQAAMNFWDGRNPNFLTENGDDIVYDDWE